MAIGSSQYGNCERGIELMNEFENHISDPSKWIPSNRKDGTHKLLETICTEKGCGKVIYERPLLIENGKRKYTLCRNHRVPKTARARSAQNKKDSNALRVCEGMLKKYATGLADGGEKARSYFIDNGK